MSQPAVERSPAVEASPKRARERIVLQRLLPFLTSEGTQTVGDIADSLIAEGAIEEGSVSKTMTLLAGLHQKGVVDVL